MLRPPSLEQGDIIRIISTARKISLEELTPAVDVLTKWGFTVQLGSNLFKEHHQFAGTTDQRATDLQEAIDDPKVKCILCARGGYGTVKIIDRINFTSLLNTPKWIVGFSDVTVLHSHLHHLGIESLHATMPILFNQDGGERALESLQECLSGRLKSYSFESHSLNKLGEATGELVGGNLSILNSLIGTNSDINTEGKILFLEDLDEYIYHIDRMMSHLERAGKLNGLSGLVIGGMSDMNDNTIPYGQSALEIIHDTVKPYNFPVSFNLPAGHIPDNRTLILGRVVTLSVGTSESKLTF